MTMHHHPSLVTKKQRKWFRGYLPPTHDNAPPYQVWLQKSSGSGAQKIIHHLMTMHHHPSLVTKKQRKWFRWYLPPTHDNGPPYQVWLQKSCESGSEGIFHQLMTTHHHTKFGYKKVERGIQSAFPTWLMIMPHHPKFGYKKVERGGQTQSAFSTGS